MEKKETALRNLANGSAVESELDHPHKLAEPYPNDAGLSAFKVRPK